MRQNPAKGVSLNQGEANPSSVLTESNVKEIRKLWRKGKLSGGKIAAVYGITKQHVSSIVLRKCWKHVADSEPKL